MTLDNLEEKVSEYYYEHAQWLNLTSQYETQEKQTEQTICLINEKKNECIFCVTIQTFSNLESGWEHMPYLIYRPQYCEFTVTVPKFGYLTQEEINKAIKFIIRENVWLLFNIRIDGIHI